MKTTNKQEVINYLTKTSQHTFSYEDKRLFKIVKDDDKFFIIDENSFRIKSDIDIDQLISDYQSNSKCVLKHKLFLNKKVISVKTNKFTKEKIDTYFPEKNKVYEIPSKI